MQRLVGVDLDGVVFDYHSAALQRVLEATGLREGPRSVNDLQHHDIRDNYPSHLQDRVDEAVRDHCLSYEHYRKLQFLEDGLRMVDCILRNPLNRVQFLTARSASHERFTFLALSARLYRMGHYLEVGDLLAFGNTPAKAAYIAQVGFDAVVEDNPALYHLLGESLPEDGRLLLAQPWNRSETKLRRYSHSEIQNLLCRSSIHSSVPPADRPPADEPPA